MRILGLSLACSIAAMNCGCKRGGEPPGATSLVTTPATTQVQTRMQTLVQELEKEASGAERSACGPASAPELRAIIRQIEQQGSLEATNGCEVFCAFVSRPQRCPQLLIRAVVNSNFQYGKIEVCDSHGQVIQGAKPSASIGKWRSYPEIAMFGVTCFIQTSDVHADGPTPVIAGEPIVRSTQRLADVKVRVVDMHGHASNEFQIVDADQEATAKVGGDLDGIQLPVPGGVDVDMSQDGRLLVSANESDVQIWGCRTGQAVGRSYHFTTDVVSAVISRDGQRVGIMDRGGAEFYDVGTAKQILDLPGMRSVAFGADGTKCIALNNSNRTSDDQCDGQRIDVWDLATCRRIASITNGAPIKWTAFSPDGNRILALGGGARLWDIATGKMIAKWPADCFPVPVPAAFSPDGKRVATLYDLAAEIRDAGSGKLLAIAREANASVDRDWNRSVVFDHDGSTILTCTSSYARIWDSKTGAPKSVHMATDNAGDLDYAMFNGNDNVVMTVGTGRSTALWAAQNGMRLYTFQAAPGDFELLPNVTMSGDGHEVACTYPRASGGAGYTKIWQK